MLEFCLLFPEQFHLSLSCMTLILAERKGMCINNDFLSMSHSKQQNHIQNLILLDQQQVECKMFFPSISLNLSNQQQRKDEKG